MPFTLASIDDRAVLVADGSYHDLQTLTGGEVAADPMAALAAAPRLHELSATLTGSTAVGAMSGAELGPPVPRPRNCYSVAFNYHDPDDDGSEPPTVPAVGTKFPSCITGPTAVVELRSDACDYEGELVVVVGPGGKDIEPEDAWDHVVGLMVGQDISDRGLQFAAQPPHLDLGRSFDTFGPTGPVLVSPDLVPDRDALRIVTTVNGDVRQDDTTDHMVFDVATLVSYLSRVTTLSTGDLVFTGTPGGIGALQGLFLTDGDEIRTEIVGIGTLTNTCRRVSDY